jgi:cytochrome c biogenesis factor
MLLRALSLVTAAIKVFGWLIALSGIVESVHAFPLQKGGGLLLHIIPGIAGSADWLAHHDTH